MYWILCFLVRSLTAARTARQKKRTKRPNFFFILDNVCVFRGEETSPDVSMSLPTAELCLNLVWAYGNVPYVFGYAASGFNIDLLALHLDHDGLVTNTRIGTFNFQLKEHLFKAVLAILNLSLLFTAIVEACPATEKDEYGDILRSNGVLLRLYPTCVEKVFPDTTSFNRVKELYGQMEQAGVPNVDRLIRVEPPSKKRSLLFGPRGTKMRPTNLLELFGALQDVLQALVALHRLGWMHRDIRWANVMTKWEVGSWFLTDFTDAATSPQPSASGQHLSVEEHAPEIFVNNAVHSTAVDIWAIGLLIKTSGVGWLDCGRISSLYERLIATDPRARPSAEDALADLVALEEAAK